MADSRINLLTSAPSTANDDFFVVDGGTNGTRKLNAFSPTIGGDPTITGTLTVNGTSLANGLVVNGNGLALNTAGSASVRFQDAGTSKWWVYKLTADPNLYFRDMVNGRMQMTFVPNATSGTAISYLFSNLVVDSTAASTTTATGAVVIGGGLGVGGSIYAGGDIAIPADRGIYIKQGNPERWTSDGTPTGTSRADIYADSGGAFFIRTGGLTQALTISSSQNATFAGSITAGVGTHSFGTSAGGGVNNFGALLTYFNIRSTSDSDNPIFRIYDGRVNVSAFEVNARTQVVTLPGTTNSTATSIGALVVSGGVGVAKTIRVGEEVIIDQPTANPTLLRLYSNGGAGTYTNFAESSMGGQSTNVAFLRWTRGGNEDRELSVHVSNYAGTSIKATTIDPNGNLIQRLNGAAASLTTNSTMTFELTSNTSLKIFVRGSDGTTRSTTLTLA